MRRLLIVIECFLSSAVSAQTSDVLPLAHGKFSVAFAQSTKAAPLAQGTTVKFLASKDTAAPRELRFDGFVLGTLDSVVFVEVSQEEAAYLAHLRVSHTIKLQMLAAPDKALIADRRRAAEADQKVTIAPRFRNVTVPIVVTAATVDKWSVGDRLVFPDAGEEPFYDWQLKTWQTRRANAYALFVSAEPLDKNRFELTALVDPESAVPLLQTSLQGRLSVLDDVANPVETIERHRCYIRHRRGLETLRIEIPCVD